MVGIGCVTATVRRFWDLKALYVDRCEPRLINDGLQWDITEAIVLQYGRGELRRPWSTSCGAPFWSRGKLDLLGDIGPDGIERQLAKLESHRIEDPNLRTQVHSRR